MRKINETVNIVTNASKYFIGQVESVDENYLVTFSIPGILQNLTKYPNAYPKETDHVREVKVGDSILVHQLDASVQFFMYSQLNINNKTGLYFGGISLDISDGSHLKLHIDSKTSNIDIEVDGETGLIDIKNDKYSFGEFLKSLQTALSNLTTIGNQATQSGKQWYNTMLLEAFTRVQQLFKY